MFYFYTVFNKLPHDKLFGGVSAGVKVQQWSLMGVLYPTQTSSATTPLVEVIYGARNRGPCNPDLANQTDDDSNIRCSIISRSMYVDRCLVLIRLHQIESQMCSQLSNFENGGSSFFFSIDVSQAHNQLCFWPLIFLHTGSLVKISIICMFF